MDPPRPSADSEKTVVSFIQPFPKLKQVQSSQTCIGRNLEDEIIQAEKQLQDGADKKVRRKVDMFLLPIMMTIVGLQYADKTSLATGVLFGLQKDTHLVGQDYAWLTTIFYLGYLVSQPLVNLAMQKFDGAILLSWCVVVWGAMVMCLAACNNFTQLMVVRFLLGALEAIVSPGFLLIISSWYKKSEQNTRQLMYLALNLVFVMWISVAVYFIAKRAEEVHQISGWRAINLFLGSLTVVVGLISAVFLRLPSNAWWLSDDEKKVAQARIIENGTGDGEAKEWKWDQVKDAFIDPNTSFLFFLSIISSIPSGGIGAFQSVIYASFGFTPLQVILYSLPSIAILLFWTLLALFLLRIYPKLRFFIMAFTLIPAFASILAVGLLPPGPSYKWTKYRICICSVTFALNLYLIWTLMPSIIAGRTKKTVVLSMTFIGSCKGNMIGPQIFQASDAPRYIRGLIVTSSMFGLNFLLTLVWLGYLVMENRRRRKVLNRMGVTEERQLQNKVNGQLDMTDNKNIYFIYNW